ncbi:MAG: hypothetical protein LBT92_02095 [Rickettsiales bacterium]|jgi:hypothetical protein|nr:hypothetical protein [Rickettsiales bacterium]
MPRLNFIDRAVAFVSPAAGLKRLEARTRLALAGGYIGARKDMGVTPDTFISPHDRSVMLALVKAIIRHENGVQPYSDDQILEGMRL